MSETSLTPCARAGAAPAAVRLRSLDRALRRLRARPRHRVARRRDRPRLRRPRGPDRGCAGRRGRRAARRRDRTAGVLRFLGLPFDLAGFTAWAAGEPTLARLATALAGFRPPLQTNPFEALVTSITAQQVSLQSAAAIRSRFVERYGTAHQHAYAFPERERVAQATEDELVAVGFSTRKAEYVIGLARSDLDLVELETLPDEEVTGAARRAPRTWRMDGGLVSRPPPGAAARLACRRPGTTEGGGCVLW